MTNSDGRNPLPTLPRKCSNRRLAAWATLRCPSCNGSFPLPNGRDTAWSTSVAWADGSSAWSVPVAADPASVAAARAPSTARSRKVIYALLGLAAFFLAGIAVLKLARQLRPWVTGRDRPGVAANLPKLLRQLKSPGTSPEKRQEAARTIVAAGPDTVAAALDDITSAIEDSDGPRFSLIPSAVSALAGIGPQAVGPLTPALSAPKAKVRFGAASVLREMGPTAREAVAPLITALEDQNAWVRWYAAEALGNIGPEAALAIKPLVRLVESPDAYTRRRAVEALGRIGPAAKEVLPALVKTRDKDLDSAVRRAASVALHQIDLPGMAAQATKQTTENVRQLIRKLEGPDEFAAVAAAKKLGEMGILAKDAIPALALALQNKSPWVREASAKALGNMGLIVLDVVPFLQTAAKDPEPKVAAAATKAIQQIEGRPGGR